MDKQIITFTANEQCLRKTGGLEVFATKTVSYIEAHFDLGDNWSGYDSVRAVWWNDYVRPISTVLDTEGVCIVPTEVLLRKGTVYVNLVGSIAEGDVLTDRLTTIPITALVEKFNAHVDSTETAPITPSQFDQFVQTVKADADRAEDAKDDARGYASDAQTYAENASTSATNAGTSEDNAKVSELNAEAYKNQAQLSAESASASATEAEEWADKAEQSAQDAGYMEFHIDDNGHLIFERTSNVDQIDFSLVNGHLILEVA